MLEWVMSELRGGIVGTFYTVCQCCILLAFALDTLLLENFLYFCRYRGI